ncbi:MAG: hypothetical protein ABSD67_01500 [Terracidiphilus sp.]|jgi:hypothetical protein
MDLEISRAWRQAAADLGIRVEAPVALVTENGETVWFEAHVLDFGGPKGAIVAGKDGELGGVRKRLGYYYSNLFPTYRIYARQYFIDTLNDWGWFGEDNRKPAWVNGKHRS